MIKQIIAEIVNYPLAECVFTTSHKVIPSNKELRGMMKYGQIKEYNVRSCSERLFYAGPNSLDNWIERMEKQSEMDLYELVIDFEMCVPSKNIQEEWIEKWLYNEKEITMYVRTSSGRILEYSIWQGICLAALEAEAEEN